MVTCSTRSRDINTAVARTYWLNWFLWASCRHEALFCIGAHASHVQRWSQRCCRRAGIVLYLYVCVVYVFLFSSRVFSTDPFHLCRVCNKRDGKGRVPSVKIVVIFHQGFWGGAIEGLKRGPSSLSRWWKVGRREVGADSARQHI